jgi:hypothetical protein
MSAERQERTHVPRLELRLLVPQPADPIALFPFSSLHSFDHFEGHFEESVPVFAPADFAYPISSLVIALRANSISRCR